MLVFANPHQRVLPIEPYALSCLAAALSDLGHEVVIDDPFLSDVDPIAACAARARQWRPDVIGLSVRQIDDCVVVDGPDGEGLTDLAYFLPEIKELRMALSLVAPKALMVAGGAAFLSMAAELLDYLEVEWGVSGPGEATFRALIERLAAGQPIEETPGLTRRGEPVKRGAPILLRGGAHDPRYAPLGNTPIRSRNGCAMRCIYCISAQTPTIYGEYAQIAKEVESAIAMQRRHGLDRYTIMFTDDEINLPDEKHLLALLDSLVHRGLTNKLMWRGYFHPRPFSDELMAAIRATNGLVSLTFDSAADAVLERAGKNYRLRDLVDLVARLERSGLRAGLSFLFGLPGETEKTIGQTLDFIRTVPGSMSVNYATGVRIYPGTPLEAIAAKQTEHVIRTGSHPLDPAVYCSPISPRALARELHAILGNMTNVKAIGPGYQRNSRLFSEAYRACRRGPHPDFDWSEMLDQAQFWSYPDDTYEALLILARWHDRQDWADQAAKRLAAVGGAFTPVMEPGP
jgi:hypothetical protein